MSIRTISFCMALSLWMAGCDYSKLAGIGDADSGNKSFNLPAEQQAQLSYAYVYQNVFFAKCISCHGNSGDVNLESYQATRAHLSEIKVVVFQKQTMPKDDQLTTRQKEILWTWLHMGAPENSESDSPPSPPTDPLTPTFDSIAKNIFVKTCITCHSAGHSAKRVLLDKNSLLNSPLDLVLPGDPDNSGLVIAIERTDNKRMPPAKHGYSALSDFEKKVIREWIINGAKD